MIALLPLRYPTIVDTEYFGGIEMHRWIWSRHALPSSRLTPLYSHSRRKITPTSWRNLPKMILRRLFDTQTTWYLHSHTVCDRLFFTCCSFRIGSATEMVREPPYGRSFFVANTTAELFPFSPA